MKLVKWLLWLVLIFVVIMLGFWAYIGGFSTPKVSEQIIGPYTIAYQPFVGPYKDCGPVFETVYQSLKNKGIATTVGLGIYYDDPSQVAADKLRSDLGCVIEPKDVKTIGKELKVKTLLKTRAIVAELPLRHSLSMMVGPMKAYPALVKYQQANNLKIIAPPYEVYDMSGGKILYIMPIAK